MAICTRNLLSQSLTMDLCPPVTDLTGCCCYYSYIDKVAGISEMGWIWFHSCHVERRCSNYRGIVGKMSKLGEQHCSGLQIIV